MGIGYFSYPGLVFVLPGNNAAAQYKAVFIYSSQLAAITGFSLYAYSFILSTRMKWLEDLFGGLDKIYHTHHSIGKKFRGFGAIIPGFSADSMYSLGVRLGNIETSATLGIEGRIGWNLPNDFWSYPIRSGAENRPREFEEQRTNQGHGSIALGIEL